MKWRGDSEKREIEEGVSWSEREQSEGGGVKVLTADWEEMERLNN